MTFLCKYVKVNMFIWKEIITRYPNLIYCSSNTLILDNISMDVEWKKIGHERKTDSQLQHFFRKKK